jgi:hypothetical protein
MRAFEHQRQYTSTPARRCLALRCLIRRCPARCSPALRAPCYTLAVPSPARSPTRAQKRWGGRLRTGGALGLLGGTVGLLDRVLPHANDPVLGPSPLGIVLPIVLVVAGAAAFLVGRRWR